MSKNLFRNLIFPIACLASTLSIAAEEGIASYYSEVFQGKKTASGALYDRDKMTAAHKTLAFGTKVRITDLDNGKSVVVTITDRGPQSKKRMVDLSYAAAEKIGLIKAGISEVRMEVIEPENHNN